MKKWKTFLRENQIGKRMLSLCLAMAMVLSLFGGMAPVARAVQDSVYYGDTPDYKGYYWRSSSSYFIALSRDLASHRELYPLYDQSGIISVRGNEDSKTEFVGGYNTAHKVITGRVDMIKKWKLFNFKVDFLFPSCSEYYPEFMERDVHMYLNWDLTDANGMVKNYRYNGYSDPVTYGASSFEEFVDITHLAKKDQWHTFLTFTAPILGKVSNVRAVFAEGDSPVIQSWYLQNREDDTPLIWAVFSEPLQPADTELLNRQLLGEVVNVKVELTPANDPNGERMTVNAKCVEFMNDGKLGFEIIPEDWARLQEASQPTEDRPGRDWTIRNIYDNSTYGSYKIKFPWPLNGYQLKKYSKTEYYTAPLPIVDSVGNSFRLRSSYRDINIRLDTQVPTVSNVFLTGDSLPAAQTGGMDLDSWEDTPDLNWADLFAGSKDTFAATVELSEQVQDLTAEERGKIYLEWSVLDNNGNPLRTYLSEMKNAAYVNGSGNISQLVFKPLNLQGAAASESGKQIKPVRLVGAQYIKDGVNNILDQDGTCDITVNTDKQMFLDIAGPKVTLDTLVKGEDLADGATYSAKLTFTDKTSDEAGRYFAGMVGGSDTVMGSFSLYTTKNTPPIGYSYTLLPAEEDFDGNYQHTGTMGGESTQTPVPVKIVKEGAYILYLKLDNQEGKEIADDTGAVLNFTLWDILGNTSRQTQSLTNLELDRKAPEASAQSKTVITPGETNAAEFAATVTASDLNGIKRIDYTWGSDGITNQQPYELAKEVTFQIPAKSYSGEVAVSDTLTIKVYDKYDNETVLDTISFSADLSKLVPQAEYVGDPNVPANTNNILITAPISTDGGGKAAGFVRVVWEKSAEEVVIGTGSIGADETISLFGENGLKWVSAKTNGTSYSNVTELADSGLAAHYGYANFTLWVAADELAVANGSAVTPADMTAQSMAMSIARTSERNDVHTVTFGAATLASGVRAGKDTFNSIPYYYSDEAAHAFFQDTFAGVRYPFTIANGVLPNWTTVDVDWDNSYAVLIRANADGTLPDTDEEVSARQSLTAGVNQVMVVPNLDKDGNAFTTGVYAWKVVLAQKAGGQQVFEAPARLLLDAVEINAEFGVYSYENTPMLGVKSYGSYDASNPDTLDYGESHLSMAQYNEDGSPLTSIDVGVADAYPGWGEFEIVKDANGRDAYGVLPINGGGYLQMDISVDTTQFGGDTYLGHELGLLEGIRYWNADAPVDLEALPFELTGAGDATNRAYLMISENVEWYDENSDRSIVVEDLSALEPAKTHDDFRVTLGKNRIAYQLKLTNGKMSNVKYFDLVLRPVGPTLSVEFTPGEGRIHDIIQDDGTVFQQVHTNYATASVTGFTSVSGSLDFYQLTAEPMYSGGYVYARNKIADPSNIRLTQGGHGYKGLPTQNYVQPDNRDYFLAVDEYGNGVIILPIIGTASDTEDTRFDMAIIPELGKISSLEWEWATKYDVTEKGRYRIKINHLYSGEADNSIQRIMDGYSVQVDDREPVYISAAPVEYIYDDEGYSSGSIDPNELVVNGINDAGIDTVHDYGAVELSFPYDPNVGLGAQLDHTVTVRAYFNGEITDEASTFIGYGNSKNLRPTLLLDSADFGWAGFESKYTDLTEEKLAAGQTWSDNGIRFGDAYTKLDGTDNFGTGHDVRAFEDPYTVNFVDKFGDQYTQAINLNLPDDPKVTFSTTEPTAGPVVVTVTSEKYDLYLERTPNYENPGNGQIAVPEGTVVEGEGTKELILTLYNNSDWFHIENPAEPDSWYSYRGIPLLWTDEEDGEQSRNIYVDNIYNEPVKPIIRWTYREQDVLETYVQDGTTYNNVIFGTVDAVLVDENDIPLIDPRTGETPRFTFEPGGVTSYTFSGYTNIAGVAGADITATLPVNLLWYAPPVNPEAPEAADTWAPVVAMNGSAIYNGDAQAVLAAYVNAPARPAESPMTEEITDWKQGWTNAYGADMVFSDSANLISCFGWADTYRLDLSILDESATRVFITAADNASAPGYNGQSDAVAGVSVIGRSVAVTQNTGFYIHVVDAEGNATSIPVQVTALGTEAPEPGCVVVLSKDSTQARAYLLPPNVAGVTNLKITTGTFAPHPDAQVEDDTASSFYGNPYLVYTDNGAQTLYYSYELNGRTITGEHSFNIDKIDKSGLVLLSGYPKWSANYDGSATADNVQENWVRMTNRNITAQYSFNKSVADVYFTDASGNKVTPDFASVSFLGTQVTVEFIQNSTQSLKLVCVSATNSSDIVTLDLQDIVTIDKVAPAIYAADVIYAADHRSATITVNVSEKVVLQSNGQYLTGSDGVYLTTKVVRENGEYTFAVSDRAGNRVSKTVSVTGIVTEGLTMVLASSASDDSILDPSGFAPQVGDTVYVKTSRNARITVDHTDNAVSVTAGQWTAVTITESLSGLYPIIRAVDGYGNTAIIQLDSVPLRDGNAPNVILRKSLIAADLNSSDEEMNALLKSNLLASDDTTSASELVYTFEYTRPTAGGKVSVTYHVTDSSGNTTTCTGQIRFFTDKELMVKVNGQVVERDETAVVKMNDIDLHVDSVGEPYKIMWKSGIKTVAQVKINAQTLTSYTDEAKSYAPEFTEAGYYTIVITTQAQDTYRIILYVEN